MASGSAGYFGTGCMTGWMVFWDTLYVQKYLIMCPGNSEQVIRGGIKDGAVV